MQGSADLQRRAGAFLVLISSAVLIAQCTGGSDSHGTPSSQTRSAPAGRGVHAARPIAQPSGPLDETRQRQLDGAVADVLSHSAFVTRAGGKRRQIALTFDDGPGPYTPQILRELNRRNAKATFFVVGRQEGDFHTATMAEIGRGHAVGDHTENHPRLARLAPADQFNELLTPIQWLSKYGLPRPVLFRPPYGSYNQTTLDALKALHMLMVLWSVDSQDYDRPGVGQIVGRVADEAKPGAIVLLHDGGGDRSQTVKALPLIIRRLRAKHYHLVTVPQLLHDDPPPPGRRLPQLRSEG